MVKTELWVCGYDLHYPKVNWPTWNAMLDFIRQNKIDGFVFGGDQFDNQCISHHTKGKPGLREKAAYKRDEDGFKKKILEPLESALGGAKRVWIVGNHDNWEQELVDEAPELDGIQRIKTLPLSNWEVSEFGKRFRHGKLDFVHGEAATGVGNQGSVMHSRKMVDLFCTNVVYGHMHSPQSFTKVLPFDEKEKWQAYCLPILGDTNPSYLHNRPTAWLNGFGIVEFLSSGCFNVYSVVVVGGKFVFGGKVYGISKN